MLPGQFATGKDEHRRLAGARLDRTAQALGRQAQVRLARELADKRAGPEIDAIIKAATRDLPPRLPTTSQASRNASAGGVWRPSIAALGVICEAGVHRFNEALRICIASPMAGTWHN